MAVSAYWYGAGLKAALSGGIDWDTDTIKASLHTSSYTPDRSAHDYFNDLTNEVSGTGYTAGGATLASAAVAYVAANSWATSRANSTAYVVGQVVRPATGNGYLYQCITAGTSGGSVPTYPTTIGGTVTDGGVTWLCVGVGAVTLDANDASWGSSSITAARYMVIRKDTGTSSTSPLLVLVDFGADVSTTSGTLSGAFDANGIAVFIIT